ncbi:MAG: 3-carboxy-cis,cis-muconate cycloisomerase [Candidatus Binatia bacterium]
MAAAFDDRARLQGMLDFEAALARAEAEHGILPRQSAAAIAAACDAAAYDVSTLSAAAAQAGNPAIPMVEALTAEVARHDGNAARFVHWGATSQDAIDTGLVLQIRGAYPLLDSDLDRLERTLAKLAEEHAATVMVGRTLLQHAVPITFGLKAAGWLSALMRVRRRLAEAIDGARVLQFGGAAGTLASLGGRGLEVAPTLAHELGLALPDLPWHGHRDRLCDVAGALALVAGALGKLARDVSLMMQSEVGELREAGEGGKGRSSAMPQKRNPVGCSVALAAAARVPGLVATLLAAMPQEHERGLGGWQAEWETIPEIFGLVAGSARAMGETCDGLEIDATRMRENLDRSQGLVMAEAVMVALAGKIGRPEARALIEAAVRRARTEGGSFGAVLRDDPTIAERIDPGDLDRLLDPECYLGNAAGFLSRVLATRAGR